MDIAFVGHQYWPSFPLYMGSEFQFSPRAPAWTMCILDYRGVPKSTNHTFCQEFLPASPSTPSSYAHNLFPLLAISRLKHRLFWSPWGKLYLSIGQVLHQRPFSDYSLYIPDDLSYPTSGPDEATTLSDRNKVHCRGLKGRISLL